jgi:hypothetical protein
MMAARSFFITNLLLPGAPQWRTGGLVSWETGSARAGRL